MRSLLASLVRPLRRGAASLSRGAADRCVALLVERRPSTERPEDPRAIFVLRNNDIGDLLVVTPMFRALKSRFPAAQLTVGVGSWSRDVLLGNPWVDRVVSVDAPWFNHRARGWAALPRCASFLVSDAARSLREAHFDIGIDVLGSSWGALLLLQAHIPYRIGTSGYAGGDPAFAASVDFDPQEHVSSRAMRLAGLLGAETGDGIPRPEIFLSGDEREQGERFWKSSLRGAPRVVIAPGAGVAARGWPHFTELARRLRSLIPAQFAVLGGPKESTTLKRVAEALGDAPVHSAPGLRASFAIVAAADVVVANSSMLLHVAAAFGKQSVVLLGAAFSSASTHQNQWGYEGLSISCGKEPSQRDDIFTPAEAAAVVGRAIARQRNTDIPWEPTICVS